MARNQTCVFLSVKHPIFSTTLSCKSLSLPFWCQWKWEEFPFLAYSLLLLRLLWPVSAMSAWPGVQFNSISTFWDFKMSMVCLISSITALCVLFSRPRVRIPTADWESENSIIFCIGSLSIYNFILPNAVLMATNSPRRIEDLPETGCLRSTLSSFGRNKHAPAPQGPGPSPPPPPLPPVHFRSHQWNHR